MKDHPYPLPLPTPTLYPLPSTPTPTNRSDTLCREKQSKNKKTLPFPSSWVEMLKKQIRNASSMFRKVMKSFMPQLKNILKSPVAPICFQ